MKYSRQIIFAVLTLIAVGGAIAATILTSSWLVVEQSVGIVTDTTEPAFALARSEPTLIRIPRVDVVAEFETPLGLNSDQTIEVPEYFDTVGWYRFGPTPGELGPAVVLGHVDSYDGPAIFFSLGQLESGDDIFIERADGSTVHFRVTRLERVAQDTFPTAQVYGDISYAGLRLITCSGTFIRGEQRYTHNLIVFAELVEPA